MSQFDCSAGCVVDNRAQYGITANQTVIKYSDFMNQWIQDNILESKLYSDHLEVAGTVDCVGEYNGKLSIIDFKTSSRVKTKQQISDYFMQTSAYAVAFEERTKVPVSNLLIIMAVAHEGCVIFEEKRDNYSQFLERLKIMFFIKL